MNTESPTARSSRRSAGLHSLLRIGLAIIILVLANFVAFKKYTHKDLSASQFYTLSSKTKELLKKLDSPLQIYTFLNDQSGVQSEEITNLLKEYQDAGGKNVSVEKIDIAYDGKRAADLQKDLHFDGNDHLVILKYKDKSPRFVKQDDLFDTNPMTGQPGAFKGEQQLTAAILALVEGKPAKVYFIEGHGERSTHDTTTASGFGFVAATLKNENVESGTINLVIKGEVPADADAVIIAGPTVAFSAAEVQSLEKYLDNNGKLLVLVDPYVTHGLDPLLQKYGMKFEDDLVLFRTLTTTGGEVTVPLAYIYQGGFAAQPITTRFAQTQIQLIINNARSITLAPATGPAASKTQFLLQTPADAWGWISKDGAVPADPKQLTYNKVTDIVGPLTVAAQYDGGTATDPVTKAARSATRVVAVGCSKFLQNQLLEPVGQNFFTNAVDWLVKKDAVLEIAPKKPLQYGVTLSAMSYNVVVWCAVFIIPGVALLLGILTWFSRRK